MTGERLTPGPMPWWCRLALGAGAVAVAAIWVDYIANWRWVLSWLTGGTP